MLSQLDLILFSFHFTISDIDLQLFENSPCTMPLAERGKVKFSVPGVLNHKPMHNSDYIAKSKDSRQPSQSGSISKMSVQESSLAAIGKEYDSSESESVPSSDRNSQICSQQSSSAAGSNSLLLPISMPFINSYLGRPEGDFYNWKN